MIIFNNGIITDNWFRRFDGRTTGMSTHKCENNNRTYV